MFPPTRKTVVTTPISTQEKMKLNPTPLWKTGADGLTLTTVWSSGSRMQWQEGHAETHAMSMVPPVLEMQPRVVGEACLSYPRVPHSRPR